MIDESKIKTIGDIEDTKIIIEGVNGTILAVHAALCYEMGMEEDQYTSALYLVSGILKQQIKNLETVIDAIRA